MMGWISEEFPATTLAINEYTLGRIVAALKGAFVFIFRHPCFQCAIVHCAFRPRSSRALVIPSRISDVSGSRLGSAAD
jgi:hypothetical protein